MKKYIELFIVLMLTFFPVSGQQTAARVRPTADNAPSIVFQRNVNERHGFDRIQHPEWSPIYESWKETESGEYKTAYKSVGVNSPDIVDADLFTDNQRVLRLELLSFEIEGTGEQLEFLRRNETGVSVMLPGKEQDFAVIASYDGEETGKLQVRVYPEKVEYIRIVPLVKGKWSADSIQRAMNRVYRQANIRFEVIISPLFKHENIDPELLLDNPGNTHDQFTRQMREIRDIYLEAYPSRNHKMYTFFIIPGFVDQQRKGYMVKGKAPGFIRNNRKSREMGYTLARQLGYGMGHLQQSWMYDGPDKGTTENLMDQGRTFHLRHDQWEDLRSHPREFLYFDDYEEVKTNNGIVAYYFWKENAAGDIVLKGNGVLSSIERPFKKNTFSYHLEINHFFYKTLFTIKGMTFSLMHFVGVFIGLAAWWWLGRKFRRYLAERFKRSRFFRFLSRLLQWALMFASVWYMLVLVNLGYSLYEVRSGEVKELDGKRMSQVIRELGFNVHPRELAESQLSSEIIVENNKHYTLKQRKNVLYFDAFVNDKSQLEKLRLTDTKDSLCIEKDSLYIPATSHYLVFRMKDKDGVLLNERVFNHLGFELTDKLLLKDPPKRILVFVNGYRPTSLGNTFEENFKDIREKGLEFPNSFNRIYNYDRYNYWNPWKEIDELFKKRINPSETCYADGHFSVSTSNHRSLLNFTTTASMYPQRCVNPEKHRCYTTQSLQSRMFGNRTVNTYSLHRTWPNRHGFNERRKNGRIAGRNMLQLLNELPNKSENDTLFIVAHSMGYAYVLGMLDVMRGKIQLGEFYILAPENASAGSVDREEWQQIWQYGSNFNKKGREAPCLQDGVAPQTAAGGLTGLQRIYIPKQYYQRKGFFDSHFVGYYNWILDIPKGEKGHIEQR